MTFLDPIRINVSGDKDRALSHVPEARAIAFSISKQVMSSGATSGRRTVTKPDGTTITVIKAGDDVSTRIVSPGGEVPEEATIAYVATSFSGVPGFYIVDVDRQKIINQVSFPSYASFGVTGLALAPDGASLFVMLMKRTIIKVDLNKLTASSADITLAIAEGESFAGNSFFTDLIVSDDGERLHVRYTATGIPSGGTNTPSGSYGGVATIDATTLLVTAIKPNHQFSTLDYCIATHPKKPELVYFTAYGIPTASENDDTNGASTDPNVVPESILYAEWEGIGPAVLGGDTVYRFYLPGSRGARRVEITDDGSRAYVSNTRGTGFTEGSVSFTDAPSIVQYDVEGGTLTRGQDLLMGLMITGAITASHDGTKLFVIEVETGVVHPLDYDADTNVYSTADTFSCLPKDATLGDFFLPYRYRHMVRGPKRRQGWDKRIVVSCAREKALTALTFGGKLDKTVLFETTPGILCVGTARRVTMRKETR